MKLPILFILIVTTQAVLCQESDFREFKLQTIFSYNQNQNSLIYAHLNDNLHDENTVIGFFSRMLGNDTNNTTNAPLPDIHNRNVLTLMAIMSHNTYYHQDYYPQDYSQWISVPGWAGHNNSYYFDPDNNHLQGNIFYSSRSNEVIIAFKGSSVFGQVGTNDLSEDWMMFGVNHRGCGYSYYTAALSIFDMVKNNYPNANYYFTGHSLGGDIADLLSTTVQYPAVTFKFPPDYNHLPIFEFGAYSDPIYVGGGYYGPCNQDDSPIKTKCHIGYTCAWSISDRGNLPIPMCYAQFDCFDCGAHSHY